MASTSSITPDGTIVTITGNTTTPSSTYNDLLDDVNNDEISTTSNLSKLLHANGIYRRSDFNDFNSFYIFPRNDPYKVLGTTREYIFVTKPDLHIFNSENAGVLNDQLATTPFFKMLMDNGYSDTVLKNLQYNLVGASRSPFIPLFTNYKTSNLELSSINSEDVETGTNMYGTKMAYRSSSYRSDEYTDFSIEFKDNRFLDCYLWFKAYDVYEKRKAEGKISPLYDEYAVYKIISDQMTIFKFIVGEDGESIVHWSCIWGAYPKSVPREAFSDMPADGNLRFTVNWHGSFQDDMDPLIIKHFNKLCDLQLSASSGNKTLIDLYDSDINQVTGEASICPYIAAPTKSLLSPYKRYRLLWYK